MEGKPRVVEGDAEDKESRRRKEEAEKRQAESESEQPSALEIAWAKTKRTPEEETPVEMPVEITEVKPAEVPETEPAATQEVEPVETTEVEPAEDPEIEPAAAPEVKPVEEEEPEPVEIPPVEPIKVPEVKPVEEEEPEPPESTETVEDETDTREVPDEIVEPEPEPAAKPELETKPKAEPGREPVEASPDEVIEPSPEEVATELPEAEDDAGDEDEEELLIDHSRKADDEGVPERRQPEESEEESEEETVQAPEDLHQPAEQPKIKVETAKAPEDKLSFEHMAHMLFNTKTEPGERPRPMPTEAVAMPEVTKSSRAAEEKMKVESAPKGPLAGRRIETLSRAELMTLGEGIVIDGSSLRQIYETHLIGERGLRRLVAENLRGGDLRKALRQEVLARERDFERDPAMRDLSPSIPASADSNNSTLEKLLQKAAVGVADSGEEATFFKARARYEAVRQQQQNKNQRRIVDISLVVIITTLFILVIIMYLARR